MRATRSRRPPTPSRPWARSMPSLPTSCSRI
jgi:hypothetical protein